MNDDIENGANDRRQFTRIRRQLRTELHQGGSAWEVVLVDISLNGLTVTHPGEWDADYSHPFQVILRLTDGTTFEAYAHLIHIEPDTLGFQMEHLGEEQIAPLAKLLSQAVDDEVVERELQLLDEINRQ
jgi:hypothetical protein